MGKHKHEWCAEVAETFKEKMDRTFWAGTGIASSGQNRTATEKLYEEQQVLLLVLSLCGGDAGSPGPRAGVGQGRLGSSPPDRPNRRTSFPGKSIRSSQRRRTAQIDYN